MRSAIISLITASMVIGGLAGAVDAPERPAPPSGELWNELGPDERAALKQRFERFRRLPPEQQEQLRDRWLKFKQLSPEQRQAMRERWRSFRGMPHEHRELMKKLHGRWQKMPPERRERIRKRMQERFRKMSDAELADFFRNMNTWGGAFGRRTPGDLQAVPRDPQAASRAAWQEPRRKAPSRTRW